MELEDQFRCLVGGYYGIASLDEYDLKLYVLKDIEEYIRDFIKTNPIDCFDYKYEAKKVLDSVSDVIKLQDALIVLHKIETPMELVLLVKSRLKELMKK